jgi:hypothetical protein
MTAVDTARTYNLRYRDGFIIALTAATFLPLLVTLFNFEILGPATYAATAWVSILSVLGGAHVWITLVYYFDRRWLAVFSERPIIFFVTPALILVGCIAAVMLADLPGVALIFILTFVNIWHHSRQNWGILSLVAKARGVDVRPMHFVLTYAWVFFLIGVCLHINMFGLVERATVQTLANAAVVIYLGVVAVFCWRYLVEVSRDLVVLAFSVALIMYWLPIVLLSGKPYALLLFGAAHGLQYYLLVLMSLSLRERKHADLKQLWTGLAMTALLLVIMTTFWFYALALYKGGDAQLWTNNWIRLTVGWFTGVNIVHFYLDAFMWKMSEKRMRDAHGQAFAF